MKHKVSLVLALSTFLVSGCSSTPTNNKKEITFNEWRAIALQCEYEEFHYYLVETKGYEIKDDIKTDVNTKETYEAGSPFMPFIAKDVTEATFSFENASSNPETSENYCHYYDNLSVEYHFVEQNKFKDIEDRYIIGHNYSVYWKFSFNRKGLLSSFTQDAASSDLTIDGLTANEQTRSVVGSVSYYN